MKKKPERRRDPVRSVHERGLAELRRSRANAPQTPGDEVQRSDKVGNPGFEMVIVGKDCRSEQEGEIPMDPLARLTEDTANGELTDWKVKAQIVNNPKITYTQVRDAIWKGIERWSMSGKERE